MENTDSNLKYNYIVNMGDGAFFGFGVGFASYTTIIPLFISTLTSSATLIGLIPAIHNMGWQLPQLLIANRISKMPHIKPYVMFMTVNERLPIFGLALVGLLLPKIGTAAALIISFTLLVWQGLGAGLTANAWQIMIGKVIPGDIRATFFGFQNALSNLLASVGAFIAGLLITKVAPPFNFASCFLIATGLYIISWIFLNLTKEQKRYIGPEAMSPAPVWKSMSGILKQDKSFRNFLISRFITQFGMMAFAFYTVFAVNKLGMTALQVGIMTSVLLVTQVVANPMLGWLSDTWSRKGVLVLGGIFAVLSAVLALVIKEPNWFSLVFILNGLANAVYWTIGLTLSLEFGNEDMRPTYVGMANTLIAPSTILAPLLGGLLADVFGYPVTFIVSSIFGVIAAIMLSLLVKDPVRHHSPYIFKKS
jgi:MFS family permease